MHVTNAESTRGDWCYCKFKNKNKKLAFELAFDQVIGSGCRAELKKSDEMRPERARHSRMAPLAFFSRPVCCKLIGSLFNGLEKACFHFGLFLCIKAHFIPAQTILNLSIARLYIMGCDTFFQDNSGTLRAILFTSTFQTIIQYEMIISRNIFIRILLYTIQSNVISTLPLSCMLLKC